MAARFELKKSSEGQFMFNLIAPNGEFRSMRRCSSEGPGS